MLGLALVEELSYETMPGPARLPGHSGQGVRAGTAGWWGHIPGGPGCPQGYLAERIAMWACWWTG